MYNLLHYVSVGIFFIAFAVHAVVARTATPMLTLFAVAIHEAGHFLASVVLGDRLKRISLQAGGLKLSGARPYSSYASEATIAFAGPFFNLLTAISLYSANSPEHVHLRQVSLALAVLNLLPISGFDGGNLLSCILSSVAPLKVAEKICAALSFLSLFVLWSLSVYLLLRNGRSVSLFIFSALVFIRILKKETSSQIIELIRE